MTEIPEHLLKRAQAARARADGLSPDNSDDDGSNRGLFGYDRRRAEGTVGNEPETLIDAIGGIRERFGIHVVPVPEGMQPDDARDILNAFAAMGDMSSEFIGRFADIVRRAVGRPGDGLREIEAAVDVWAAPSYLSTPDVAAAPAIPQLGVSDERS